MSRPPRPAMDGAQTTPPRAPETHASESSVPEELAPTPVEPDASSAEAVHDDAQRPRCATPALHVAALGPGIELVSLGGCCPVQGEGFIDGHPFYFRSRGTRWSLEVGPGNTSQVVDAGMDADPGSDGRLFGSDDFGRCAAMDHQAAQLVWRYEAQYGPFPTAGYITDEEALAFIAKGAALFRDAAPAL